MEPITRYTITVPHADNDGIPLPEVHIYVRARLASLFGGFSEHAQAGVWADDAGELIADESTLYTVDTATDLVPDDAAPSGETHASEIVERLAHHVLVLARQHAVYVTVEQLTRWIHTR